MSARTRIKICGVSDVDTALAAVEAGADAIGLVFAQGSPRAVTAQRARDIVLALPAFVEPVGLFVDAQPETIRHTADVVGLRTIQLHGNEDPDQAARLVSSLRVIKAIPFDQSELSSRIEPWITMGRDVVGLLLDAPAGGGGGQCFDWDALAGLLRSNALRALSPPMMLAGGLTPQNVGRAISLLRPYAVDVSSGVESSRGQKETTLVRAFCRAVRDADAAR